MTNADKAIITAAIDKAGYSWQVSEVVSPPTVNNEKILIVETVSFTAVKKTEVPMPS